MAIPDRISISGHVLDENSIGLEKVYVEAYHISFPGALDIPYFLGRSQETGVDGHFSLDFPSNAWGILFKYPWIVPDIQLRIVKDYRVIYNTGKPRQVTGPTDWGVIKLPPKEVRYSDEIDHVDWEKMRKEFLEEISGMTEEEVSGIHPEFIESIQNFIDVYLQNVVKPPINYRGLIVPQKPKLEPEHSHDLPWKEGRGAAP